VPQRGSGIAKAILLRNADFSRFSLDLNIEGQSFTLILSNRKDKLYPNIKPHQTTSKSTIIQ
jgi:hypothetical protein